MLSLSLTTDFITPSNILWHEQQEKAIFDIVSYIQDKKYKGRKIKKRGKGDTSVGVTLEYDWGIKRNSKKGSDLFVHQIPTELKANRISSSSLQSMFCSEADEKGSNRTVTTHCAYQQTRPGNKNREALYSTIGTMADVTLQSIRNGVVNLRLNVGVECISLLVNGNPMCSWNHVTFEQTVRAKLDGILVKLDCDEHLDSTGRVNSFEVTSSTLYFDFNYENFIECVKNGIILLDWRAHFSGAILKSRPGEGEIRNRGTCWRIQDAHIPKLFKNSIIVDI